MTSVRPTAPLPVHALDLCLGAAHYEIHASTVALLPPDMLLAYQQRIAPLLEAHSASVREVRIICQCYGITAVIEAPWLPPIYVRNDGHVFLLQSV